MRWLFSVVSVCVGMVLAGCGPSQTPQGQGNTYGAGGEFRFERFCQAPGLPPSQRHTYLVIDQRAINKAETPQQFAEVNKRLRDVVLAFGDPAAASQSGSSDYRERITMLILPADGSAAKLIFEGCLPSLSPDEIQKTQKNGSAINDFLTGGIQQSFANDASLFRSRLINAIVIAARAAPNEAKSETGKLIDSSLVQSLRASGRLINAEKGLPRILLLSNLSRIDLGETTDTREKARQLGFDHGKTAALELGRSELHIFLNQGSNSGLARDYAQAFFLAQHANLITWADDAPPAMPPAPIAVRRISGEAMYPNGPETVNIRLAQDRNGVLVNSWLVLRGSPDRSTPLTGQATCDSSTVCRFRSDDAGFAQAWSISPGGEPEFDAETPFGGMRSWELTLNDETMKGAVTDPAIDQVGSTPGNKSINITGRIAESANY